MPIHHQIKVIGFLGGDAVFNSVNGKQVINFNIAVSDDVKKQDGTWESHTSWYHCSYWSERNPENLKKGALLVVEGKPKPEIYQNKEGQSVAQIKIIVESARVLSKPNTQLVQQNSQQIERTPIPENYAQQGQSSTQNVEDLPF